MNNSLAIYDNFQQTKDIANALASSDLVPSHFHKKPSNVLIALEFAHRNNIAPFAAMQSLFVINGKVGMSATLAISLARTHNVWKYLKYDVKGEGEELRVKAIATLHEGDTIEAEVTMKMAMAAGWAKNPLYRSIPEQMLKYRAAVFLIRGHFPEVLFGMQTKEELDDVEYAKKPINVTPVTPKLDEPPAAKIEPAVVENDETKAEIVEFLKSRSDLWFEALGRERAAMLSAVESESDPLKIKSMYERVQKYDVLANEILEKSKKDLVESQHEIINEALND